MKKINLCLSNHMTVEAMVIRNGYNEVKNGRKNVLNMYNTGRYHFFKNSFLSSCSLRRPWWRDGGLTPGLEDPILLWQPAPQVWDFSRIIFNCFQFATHGLFFYWVETLTKGSWDFTSSCYCNIPVHYLDHSW